MELQEFKIGNKDCIALVRKLTPREVFRLMGVDDADISSTITSVQKDCMVIETYYN